MADKKKHCFLAIMVGKDFSGKTIKKIAQSVNLSWTNECATKFLTDTNLQKRSVDFFAIRHIYKHTKGRAKKCDG